jgi:hypothetical protein
MMNGMGWGVVTIFNNSRPRDERRNLPSADDALDILKKRYVRGPDWLSTEKEIRSPCFGASMLKCGEVTKTIE